MKTLLALLLLIPNLSWGDPMGFRLTKGEVLKDGKDRFYCLNCEFAGTYADALFYNRAESLYNSHYKKGKFKTTLGPEGLRDNRVIITGQTDDWIKTWMNPAGSKIFFDNQEVTLKNEMTDSQVDDYVTQLKLKAQNDFTIDKNISTCEKYGFTKGTELFQECILEILRTEKLLTLNQQKYQTYDNGSILMQEKVLEEQLRLQNSLDLMRLGLDILNQGNSNSSTTLNIPPIRCITNAVGWSCM